MTTPYEWKCELKEVIQSYLSEMRMSGFKFDTQERELKHFDDYYYYSGYAGVKLTKPMIDKYIYESVFNSQSTYYRKERALNGFGVYLDNHGYKGYIVPIKSRTKKKSAHIPYIFTKEELYKLFLAIDSYPRTNYTNRNIIDPVLFRLLYGAGLRISEALNLKCEDFDYRSSTLTIRKAKNNKDRLVPICESLNVRISDLITDIHKLDDGSTILFNSIAGGKLDTSTVYCRYRDYLLYAGIPHTVNGPRLHDIRHTYAVRCLKRWVLSGDELTNALPYLAAYMGHTDFRATQYYLRLTADLYPDILEKTEAAFGYVIPKGCDSDEE